MPRQHPPGEAPQADLDRTAERLVRLKPEIIEAWKERVRSAVPAAQQQPAPLLINNLPLFLDDLVEALRAGKGDACTVSAACRAHARERASLADYSLEQVIQEYHLLRGVLLELLDPDSPSLAARMILHESIDRGIQEAAEQFMHTRQQELLDADSRKNEFMATLAHELRTPLGAIRNALFVLEQLGIEDERALRQLTLANRQSRHLGRLVDDLLDVSRVVRGKLELRREVVDLVIATEAVLQTLRPLVEASRLQLTASLPQESLCVEADPVRLEQVISNLLSNSVRYTPEGGQICVSLQRGVESPGGVPEAVLRVRDTGMGIHAELLPHIFDLYMQAHPGFTRSRDGLGIGLTLVRRLVEIHGGRVAADSPGPGQGSQFTVWLPLVST